MGFKLSKTNSKQKGFFTFPIVAVIIIAVALIGALVLGKGEDIKKIMGIGNLKTTVDKSDPEWLEKYCMEQTQKLPEAPFVYVSKSDPRLTTPEVTMKKFIPEEKWRDAISCSISYGYDEREAFASLGVEYAYDISASNAFGKATAEGLEAQMDESWIKVSPLTDAEAGRPGYSGKDLPIVFTRVNKKTGTTEYMSAFFGVELYVKFAVFEN